MARQPDRFTDGVDSAAACLTANDANVSCFAAVYLLSIYTTEIDSQCVCMLHCRLIIAFFKCGVGSQMSFVL